MSNDGHPLTIFIAHPSHYLTDFQSHGDGLTAFGFIRELANRGHHLHVAVDEVDLAKPLPSNVVLYRSSQLFRRRSILRRLEFMVRTRLLFTKLAPTVTFDVIHQMNPVYLGLSLAFIGVKVPIVLGTYIGEWPSGSSGIGGRLRKVIKKTIAFAQQSLAAALLVTTDAAINSRLAAPKRFQAKTYRVNHGIDTDAFHPADNFRAAFERHSILFVGNLLAKKGVHEVMSAYSQLSEAMPDASLIIAGDGNQRAEIAAEIARGSLENKVSLLGNVSRDALPALMASASLLCCPSHGEPLGMVAIEGMACGLPIVSTDTGGLGELVDAQTGIRVPVGDSASLAAALGRTLADFDFAQHVSHHNRRRAVVEFSWPRVVDSLEAIYRIVAARRV